MKVKEDTDKSISSTSVNYDLRILRQILNVGISWGYLYNNPAKLVKRLKQERKEFKALTKEQVAELLKAAEALPCSKRNEKTGKETFFFVPGQPKALLMTAVCTALRRGEILAMKWKNLDWDKGTYSVKEAYNLENGFDTPKTESSLRTILLPQHLLEELARHRFRQGEHSWKKGNLWKDHGLVFTNEVGGPFYPDHLRNRMFEPILKAAGLPHIRFHDLRGTAATLALESGANIKAVQNLLGHTTPALTLQVYAKVTEASQKDLADRMGRILSDAADQQASG